MSDTTKLDQWTKIFTEWEASGQSQKTYCEERGLALSLFSYWRKRLRECTEDTAREVACFEIRDVNRLSLSDDLDGISIETTGIMLPVGKTATLTVQGRITMGELKRILQASGVRESDEEIERVTA